MQSSRRNFINTAAVTAAAAVCTPATGIHASEKKSSPAMAPDAVLDQCGDFRPRYAHQFPAHLVRKLRMKLEAAKRCGYDKAITFEFSHFMSPQSAYLQAGHLYNRYREYFGI